MAVLMHSPRVWFLIGAATSLQHGHHTFVQTMGFVQTLLPLYLRMPGSPVYEPRTSCA